MIEEIEMEELAIHGGRPVRDRKIYYGHQLIEDDDIRAGGLFNMRTQCRQNGAKP